MKKSLFPLLIIGLLICQSAYGEMAINITGYKAVFKPFHDKNGRVKIAIRLFALNSEEKILVLDPETFETGVSDAEALNGGEVSKDSLIKTPFIKALERYSLRDSHGGSGIKNGENSALNGVFLTIDLCPSRKALDKGLFQRTIRLAQTNKGAASVAIAVSGQWIERHRQELVWLLNEAGKKNLRIAWINHTYSHPYKEGVEDKKNFMLLPGSDLEKEALSNEVIMLQNNIVPSPFFRFPGLVSDESLLRELRTLSLIPIDAGAWPAKRGDIKNRDIILVHGNGNEPEGIKRLFEFYDKNEKGASSNRLELLDLRDAFMK